MPRQVCYRFTCPITGATVINDDGATPAYWFLLDDEWYAMPARIIMADRVKTNPLITPEQMRQPASQDEINAAIQELAAAGFTWPPQQ